MGRNYDTTLGRVVVVKKNLSTPLVLLVVMFVGICILIFFGIASLVMITNNDKRVMDLQTQVTIHDQHLKDADKKLSAIVSLLETLTYKTEDLAQDIGKVQNSTDEIILDVEMVKEELNNLTEQKQELSRSIEKQAMVADKLSNSTKELDGLLRNEKLVNHANLKVELSQMIQNQISTAEKTRMTSIETNERLTNLIVAVTMSNKHFQNVTKQKDKIYTLLDKQMAEVNKLSNSTKTLILASAQSNKKLVSLTMKNDAFSKKISMQTLAVDKLSNKTYQLTQTALVTNDKLVNYITDQKVEISQFLERQELATEKMTLSSQETSEKFKNITFAVKTFFDKNQEFFLQLREMQTLTYEKLANSTNNLQLTAVLTNKNLVNLTVVSTKTNDKIESIRNQTNTIESVALLIQENIANLTFATTKTNDMLTLETTKTNDKLENIRNQTGNIELAVLLMNENIANLSFATNKTNNRLDTISNQTDSLALVALETNENLVYLTKMSTKNSHKLANVNNQTSTITQMQILAAEKMQESSRETKEKLTNITSTMIITNHNINNFTNQNEELLSQLMERQTFTSEKLANSSENLEFAALLTNEKLEILTSSSALTNDKLEHINNQTNNVGLAVSLTNEKLTTLTLLSTKTNDKLENINNQTGKLELGALLTNEHLENLTLAASITNDKFETISNTTYALIEQQILVNERIQSASSKTDEKLSNLTLATTTINKQLETVTTQNDLQLKNMELQSLESKELANSTNDLKSMLLITNENLTIVMNNRFDNITKQTDRIQMQLLVDLANLTLASNLTNDKLETITNQTTILSLMQTAVEKIEFSSSETNEKLTNITSAMTVTNEKLAILTSETIKTNDNVDTISNITHELIQKQTLKADKMQLGLTKINEELTNVTLSSIMIDKKVNIITKQKDEISQHMEMQTVTTQKLFNSSDSLKMAIIMYGEKLSNLTIQTTDFTTFIETKIDTLLNSTDNLAKTELSTNLQKITKQNDDLLQLTNESLTTLTLQSNKTNDQLENINKTTYNLIQSATIADRYYRDLVWWANVANGKLDKTINLVTSTAGRSSSYFKDAFQKMEETYALGAEKLSNSTDKLILVAMATSEDLNKKPNRTELLEPLNNIKEYVGIIKEQMSGHRSRFRVHTQSQTVTDVLLTDLASSQKDLAQFIMKPACRGNWIEHNGRCYQFFHCSCMADYARDECARYGGLLAEVTSREDSDFIRAHLPNRRIWIGVNDRDMDGSWVGSRGSPLNYTNWANGEPDTGVSGGNCVFIGWPTVSEGTWMAHNCSITLSDVGYVCELNI